MPAPYHFCKFTVFSIPEHGGSWQENCTGTIATVWKPRDEDSVAPNRETNFRVQSQLDSLEKARASCDKSVSHDDLYADMSAKGNVFGATFAMVKNARLADTQSISEVAVPVFASAASIPFQQG